MLILLSLRLGINKRWPIQLTANLVTAFFDKEARLGNRNEIRPRP